MIRSTAEAIENAKSKNERVQIETEAGNWFMEFLEKALEKGMKKLDDDIAAAAEHQAETTQGIRLSIMQNS
ncbi:hypothetical protein L1887_34590 [Cichorium endivia]|nr:hypothetical protein L1887_34590 [Cichorium endivia]